MFFNLICLCIAFEKIASNWDDIEEELRFDSNFVGQYVNASSEMMSSVSSRMSSNYSVCSLPDSEALTKSHRSIQRRWRVFKERSMIFDTILCVERQLLWTNSKKLVGNTIPQGMV